MVAGCWSLGLTVKYQVICVPPRGATGSSSVSTKHRGVLRREPANLLQYFGHVYYDNETKLNNGVNVSLDFNNQSLTPGSWSLRSQGFFDRHSATVVNAKTFRNRSQRITTWNIRTLYQQGMLDNVLMEMNRMRINCLGLCEVRWTENGQFRKKDKTIIQSGGHEHQRGVALILNKRLSKYILGYWPKSDRLLLVKLKASLFNINMIVAYAPTKYADEQMIEEFYDSLDELHSNCK